MVKAVSLFEQEKETSKNRSKSDLGLDAEVSEILGCSCLKKDRYREVLQKRYGLLGRSKKTLDAIGKDLGITRERVRQIENTAIKKLLNPKCGIKHAKNFHQSIVKFLEKNGGYASENALLEKFAKKGGANELLFLLKLNKSVGFIKENDHHVNVWVTDTDLGKHAKQIIEKAESFLKDRGQKTHESELIKELESELIKSISIVNMLESSKNISKVREEENWGLIHWRDVNPRSIRDKIFLTLERSGKPMHFNDISEKINLDNEGSKDVTRQAVHNELIKDKRYILIGRGIYALSKWGYEKGVVEDVIAEILNKSEEPLHKDEIIEKVLEKRIVKKATIVLNLQKDRFRRVNKATYTLS